MRAIHDIRKQIPQFDANFFPLYERVGKDYPKMMINKERGKPFLDARKQAVIVQDEHEENLFLARHYKLEATEEAKAIDVSVEAAPVGELKRGPGRPPKLPADLK